MQFTNGVANTMANGKRLILAFEYSQKERFARALTYANEKIASANGTPINYKYILQSPDGIKLKFMRIMRFCIISNLDTGIF